MVITDLEKHLSDADYEIEQVSVGGNQYLVIHKVVPAAGKHAGEGFDVAVLRTTENPWIPQAAVHVRPHLFLMGTSSTKASALGSEWQYCSRRFDRVPNPKRFLAHILTVLGEA